MALEINVNFTDLARKSFNFTSIEQLKEFSLREAKYWSDQWGVIKGFGIGSQHAYIATHSIWRSVYDLLESWKENFKKWDEKTSISNINSQCGQWASQINGRWLWSGHAFNDAWIASYKISQATGDAFINAIVGNSVNGIGSFDILKGSVLAYEFLFQEESTLTKRRHAEEKAFSRLRGQLAEKKDELIKQVEEFQEGMVFWADETQQGFSDWHQEKKNEFSQWHSKLDEGLNQAEAGRQSLFETKLQGWESNISQLEHTYEEKLRLERPARYWAIRARRLWIQGLCWSTLLAVLLAGGIAYFTYLFTQWLSGKEMTVSLHSFQGAVLLTVIISSFVFLIRMASRLAFSAFHLQRDAEEREQLTHVYLSLVNQSQADDESRKIILQALFSRAETGLLAGESGPTMPGIDGLVGLARTTGQR